jgi:hypothetical protein
MLKTVKVMNCLSVDDIINNYNYALNNKGIYIIVEYPEKYYE